MKHGVADDVAVVIPTFNGAATIQRTVRSIQGQTVLPGRIVVADDASTDGTPDLVEASLGTGVVDLLRLSVNIGSGGARRAAIDQLDRERFQWIALLDHDDAWLPEHLETILDVQRQRDAEIVSPNAARLLPGGGVGAATWQDLVPIPTDPSKQRREILRRNFVFVGALFSRASYEAVGGFRPLRRGVDDWDLWMRMIMNGARVVGAARPTYLYTMRNDATPAEKSRSSDLLIGVVEVLERTPTELPLTRYEIKHARRALRKARAELALWDAYQAAGDGAPHQARRLALKAISGRLGVAARATAVAIAPGLAAKVRSGLRGAT